MIRPITISLGVAVAAFFGPAQPLTAEAFFTTAEMREYCSADEGSLELAYCLGFLTSAVDAADTIGIACTPPHLANNGMHFLFMIGSEDEIARQPEAAEVSAIDMMLALAEFQFPCQSE